MKTEIYRSKINGQWFVRTRYSNGRKHMASEGYKSLRAASRAARPLTQLGPIFVLEPGYFWDHDTKKVISC